MEGQVWKCAIGAVGCDTPSSVCECLDLLASNREHAACTTWIIRASPPIS